METMVVRIEWTPFRCVPPGGGVRCIVRNSAHRARAGPHLSASASVIRRSWHAPPVRPRLCDPRGGQTPAQKAAQAARVQ
ncbi:hypothetical protein SSCG_01834 [Streptomyces clavuligerus]|nr:hypothetical protein SSCG_01834 [Streptomyces clavuligerus]